jgi:hypothetical protein
MRDRVRSPIYSNFVLRNRKMDPDTQSFLAVAALRELTTTWHRMI